MPASMMNKSLRRQMQNFEKPLFGVQPPYIFSLKKEQRNWKECPVNHKRQPYIHILTPLMKQFTRSNENYYNFINSNFVFITFRLKENLLLSLLKILKSSAVARLVSPGLFSDP